MRRLLAGAIAAALVSVALPAAAARTPARIDARIGFTLYGDLAPAGGDPRAVAANALRIHAARLGVDASRFVFGTVRTSFVGTHVRGGEVRGGVPVDGTHALVTIAGDRVVQVAAYGAGSVTGGPVAAPISATTALARALAAARVTATLVPSHVTRVLVPANGRLVDTYRVSVLSATVARTFDVSAADGRVLAVRDDNHYDDGKATAFDPNPIVTKRDASLRQPGIDEAGVDTDLPCTDCDAQLRTLPLKDLDADHLAAGKLTGPWADVIGPTLPGTNGDFTFTRDDPQFETTMAYAHIDRIQRYFQSLGFTPKRENAVNAEPQTMVTLHLESYDNSFYQPGNDVMVFGTGGVDDAEDAEVIVHEYGHAVQDAQVPGWGAAHEGGAMGEGFGDFLAGAYYARTSKGFGDVCIADWDATSYSTKDPPCLRRMDTKKSYPDDMTGNSVHADGELWSAYLWRLRAKLGRNAVQRSDNVLRLVLTSQELLTPEATFADAIAALRVAAKSLKHPEWVRHVNGAAKATSMPWRG